MLNHAVRRAACALLLVAGLGIPRAAEAQVCAPLEPGDELRLDVRAPFLDRLWVRRDLLRAIFSTTLPVTGHFQEATPETIWISPGREARVNEFGETEVLGLDRLEVSRVRKSCRGDPFWDGAAAGALTGAGVVFLADVGLTVASLLVGSSVAASLLTDRIYYSAFPLMRAAPGVYLTVGGVGLVIGGVLDFALPGWVDVAVPLPPVPGARSVGLSIPAG